MVYPFSGVIARERSDRSNLGTQIASSALRPPRNDNSPFLSDTTLNACRGVWAYSAVAAPSSPSVVARGGYEGRAATAVKVGPYVPTAFRLRTNYCFSTAFVLGFLLITNGCASSPTQPAAVSGPIQSATAEELVDRINRSGAALQSLKGTLLFGFQNAAGEPIRNCSAVLLFKQPDWLLFKAYKPLIPNYFTLLTKDGNFWFHFPRANVVYAGQYHSLFKQDEYDVRLYPLDMLKSLQPQAIPTPLTKERFHLETRPQTYLLTLFNPNRVMERKLQINRQGLVIEREVFYTPQGFCELEILRGSYVRQGEIDFAKNISIRRLPQDSRFYLTLDTVMLNPQLVQEHFALAVEDGTTLRQIEG